MLLDRSNWIFSPQDLHNEWKRKADQFKNLITDVGVRAKVLSPLILLSEHIYNSYLSNSLFPGENLDKLIVRTTKKGKINQNFWLKIEPITSQPEQIEIIYYERKAVGEAIIVWNTVCSESTLIETFENIISENYEFKNTNYMRKINAWLEDGEITPFLLHEWAFDENALFMEQDEDVLLHDVNLIPEIIKLIADINCPKRKYLFGIMTDYTSQNFYYKCDNELNKTKEYILQNKDIISTDDYLSQWAFYFNETYAMFLSKRNISKNSWKKWLRIQKKN